MESTGLVTRRHLQRLLLLGLGLSAILLLSAVLVAIRAVAQIDGLTETFSTRQALAKSSIDGVESEQSELNERWRKLARKDVVRREEILDQLEQNRQQMSATLESAYEQSELLRESIYQAGHGLLRWTVGLFGLCVALSLLCATWMARASTGLFRRLESQAGDLSRLQYAFLETQENVARRFSHELHDELGQALTALKANLSALRDHPDPARIDDSMNLVDRAIGDVREMSQLLRPTALDDFGLDAALKALTDTFAQRTGITVDYLSNIHGLRLRDQTETHLFRIAQEALTNVARHAKATGVTVRLSSENNLVHLAVEDNGRGRPPSDPVKHGGLGLAGMRTRALGCGGDLLIRSEPGEGFRIAVTCPVQMAAA